MIVVIIIFVDRVKKQNSIVTFAFKTIGRWTSEIRTGVQDVCMSINLQIIIPPMIAQPDQYK